MRRLLWIPLALSQCAPIPNPPTEPGPTPPQGQAGITQAHTAAVGLPEVAAPAVTSPARFTQRRIGGILFEGVSFDARSHQLAIADQVKGPGSTLANAQAAARSQNAVASLNGGFFDPDGNTLGKVVSAGRSVGPWNAATSLCSGTYLIDHAGRMAIRSRESTEWPAHAGYRELLQTGPMLIRGGSQVGGLHRDKRASRSLLIWDGGNRWWMGRTSECSLHELAMTLQGTTPAGWPAQQALNLDGGSSSELWVSGAVAGGPRHSSHWWLKPARNYLVLVPRKSP